MSKLSTVFSAVLGIEESRVTPDLSPQNAPSWDSLNAVILMTELESAFGVKFDFHEAMSVKNVADVKTLIASKGADPEA